MKAAWAVCVETASGKPGPVLSRPAPDAIACAKGFTTLGGKECVAVRYDAIRLWKIAPSAAMPVAIPIWRNVLFVPEAIPA